MAGLIPSSFIQELLQRVDIVEVIGRVLQLKKRGSNFIALCPFHNEKSPSFNINPSKQFYHCFGCGVSGDVIQFLTEYDGLSFAEAVEQLAQQMGMQVPKESRENLGVEFTKSARPISIEVLAQVANYYREQLKNSPRTIEYLKKRGISGSIAARYALGYAPAEWENLKTAFGASFPVQALLDAGLIIEKETAYGKRYHDRFRDRVMFPIRNMRGQIIGFGGRIIDQGEPKYLNSPETTLFQKSHELYGLFEARASIRENKYVLVTEGYMDVIALAQLGFSQSVATLGTACSNFHIQKLLRHTTHIIFAFDGDEAGQRAAKRAMEICLSSIADQHTIRFLFLPEEHDPDSYIREFGQDAFAEYIQKAMPLSRFLLNTIAAGHALNTAEGRAQLQIRAKPLLKALNAPLLRHQIVQELAQLIQTSTTELEIALELTRSKIGSYNKKIQASIRRATPPSLTHQMMRILMQAPRFALLIDEETVAALKLTTDSTQFELLDSLASTCKHLGEQVSFAGLAQALNNEDPRFDDLIQEVLQKPEVETEALEQEWRGLVYQIKMRAIKEELQQLAQSGIREPEQKARYLVLMHKQQQLAKLE